MSDDIHVFICTGCGIGEAIDAGALGELVNEEYKVEPKLHPALCGEEGVALLKEALADGGKAVIGACSHREKCDVFTIPDRFVSRVSLREGVAWCQPAGEEDTVAGLGRKRTYQGNGQG